MDKTMFSIMGIIASAENESKANTQIDNGIEAALNAVKSPQAYGYAGIVETTNIEKFLNKFEEFMANYTEEEE